MKIELVDRTDHFTFWAMVLMTCAMIFIFGFLFGGLNSDTYYAKKPGFHDGVRAAVKGEWTAIEMPDGRWVTSETRLLK